LIEYYPPVSTGEWIGAISALIMIFIGLIMLVFPGLILRITNVKNESADVSARMAIRSHPAGLLIGFGLSAFLLQQPLIYLALGISWGFSALSQVLAMLIHKKFPLAYLFSLLMKVLLGLLTILAALGYFG
jgi:hypothetical protein